MEEIIERQLLIRGRAFAAFSTIEKALASGRMRASGRMLCRPDIWQCWANCGSQTFCAAVL